MIVCERFEANPSVGARNELLDAAKPYRNVAFSVQHIRKLGRTRQTSCADAAKLGAGLILPSMLLLLLYGLAPFCAKRVWIPRMLPRLRFATRSFWPR
jgi:hypothetical protein